MSQAELESSLLVVGLTSPTILSMPSGETKENESHKIKLDSLSVPYTRFSIVNPKSKSVWIQIMLVSKRDHKFFTVSLQTLPYFL